VGRAGGGDGDRCAVSSVGDVVGAGDEGGIYRAYGVEDVEADGDGPGAELDRVALQRAKMRGLVALVLQLLGVGGVEAGEVAAQSEAEGAELGGFAVGFVEVGPVEGDGAEVGGGGGHRALRGAGGTVR